jgi:hypothetical protein
VRPLQVINLERVRVEIKWMLGSKIIIYGLAEQNPSLNSLSSISIFGNNSDFQLSVSENDVKWDLNEKGASNSVYTGHIRKRDLCC